MSLPLDMSIYLNGVKLPNFSSCIRAYDTNQVINKTLGGIMYTDFLNIRRSWSIKWEQMFRSDYDIVYNYFLWQYQNHTYPVLQVPAYSINAPVMLLISDQNIRHNAVIVENFVLNVIEQYAFS